MARDEEIEEMPGLTKEIKRKIELRIEREFRRSRKSGLRTGSAVVSTRNALRNDERKISTEHSRATGTSRTLIKPTLERGWVWTAAECAPHSVGRMGVTTHEGEKRSEFQASEGSYCREAAANRAPGANCGCL